MFSKFPRSSWPYYNIRLISGGRAPHLQNYLSSFFSGVNSFILVFGLADEFYNLSYLNECKEIIKQNGIEDNIYILSGQKQMWPIIKISNLFIRPTYIDGDPISIKEALYFGVKVIASDCCPRDKRVVLFKNRDIDSLVNIVLNELLNNHNL